MPGRYLLRTLRGRPVCDEVVVIGGAMKVPVTGYAASSSPVLVVRSICVMASVTLGWRGGLGGLELGG
jgi:hypothetical protein